MLSRQIDTKSLSYDHRTYNSKVLNISNDEFEQLVSKAIDSLPDFYIAHLKNIAITYEERPTAEQLQKQGVRHGQLLLGLYEGIPPLRRANYSGVLPDKITLFKQSLVQISRDLDDLKKNIHHTLWHEIAHHFGLDHDQIEKLDRK